MNRLLVALLAAFDAVVAAAVGIALALAPLTVLWVFGFGGTADWAALWPAAVRVWQVGHLVPLQIELPDEYLIATGIGTDAASFALSLAPLAFALFTAVFAARSGARAAHAGAWVVGVVGGGVAFAALATLAAVSASVDVVGVTLWQAILMPVLVFVVPALIGAIIGAWHEGDGGLVDLVSDRVHAHERWRDVPAAIARGTGAALAGAIAVGAALLAVALAVHSGDVVALFESAHVDLTGAVVVALAQLAYLPTLVIWAMAFAAGPGFALGAGSTVSPVGTDLGVLPGIPVLGIIPEEPSSWLLLLALLVIGAGAFAGQVARRRLRVRSVDPSGADDLVPRLVVLAGIVVLSGAAVAVLAAVASGALGPGRLQTVGTAVGPVSLTIAVEVAIGAAVTLLAPRGEHRGERTGVATHVRAGAVGWVDSAAGSESAGRPQTSVATGPGEPAEPSVVASPFAATEPIAPVERVDPTATPDLTETQPLARLDIEPETGRPRADG